MQHKYEKKVVRTPRTIGLRVTRHMRDKQKTEQKHTKESYRVLFFLYYVSLDGKYRLTNSGTKMREKCGTSSCSELNERSINNYLQRGKQNKNTIWIKKKRNKSLLLDNNEKKTYKTTNTPQESSSVSACLRPRSSTV